MGKSCLFVEGTKVIKLTNHRDLYSFRYFHNYELKIQMAHINIGFYFNGTSQY